MFVNLHITVKMIHDSDTLYAAIDYAYRYATCVKLRYVCAININMEGFRQPVTHPVYNYNYHICIIKLMMSVVLLQLFRTLCEMSWPYSELTYA